MVNWTRTLSPKRQLESSLRFTDREMCHYLAAASANRVFKSLP